MSRLPKRVALIGTGMAGASCARLLADAGLDLELFEKSRGVGGRMATRRVDWADETGTRHKLSFDHGAAGFSSPSADFARFAEQMQREGCLSRWAPNMALNTTPGNTPQAAQLWLPSPDMPALCRTLLAGLPVRTGCTIDTLRREPEGWRLESAGHTVAAGFAAVVLAIPPQQAAALLQNHRPDWAQQAQALVMQPAWALMGLTQDDADVADAADAANAEPARALALVRPSSGPLACIVRNDAKPGRQRLAGLAQWVAHATPAWSQAHLEAPAAEVLACLQEALAAQLGHPLRWHHAAAHRWRYASPIASAKPRAEPCWWDAQAGVGVGVGLGVCGDALGSSGQGPGPGFGIEAAWRSARALAAAITSALGTP